MKKVNKSFTRKWMCKGKANSLRLLYYQSTGLYLAIFCTQLLLYRLLGILVHISLIQE